jgi:hypothetical protein
VLTGTETALINGITIVGDVWQVAGGNGLSEARRLGVVDMLARDE